MDDLNIFAPNNVQAEMKMSSAIKRRHILLHDEIDKESIFETCFYLKRFMDIDTREGNKRPIYLDISSYGGQVHRGMILIGLLEHMIENGWEIITTVEGYAMSMGQAIAECGTKRRAFANARFMIHALSDMTYGSLQGMQDDMEESVYTWNQMKTHLMKYSKIPEERLDYYKERQKNWYFSAQEALELGVIDEIL
jgi:ATP-dependent Clp protease protease subunit